MTEQQKSAGGTVLVEQTHYYDGVGRPITTTRTMPDPDPSSSATVVATQTRSLNGMGAVLKASGFEATSSPVHFTFFTYDALGRTVSITAPDNLSSITLAYTGTRKIERRVNNILTTTELYDDRGRLMQVEEPSGANGALTDTNYSYDVGDRLHMVSTTGATQTRTFNYDNREFLISERHPEKDGTTYYEYDAFGYATRKYEIQQGDAFDLQAVYDGAGRLTAVKEFAADGTRRPVVEYTFATSNSGSDLRRGKLWTTTRHNYGTILGNDVTVTHTYAYADTAGRLTSRTTNIGTTASYTSAPSFVLSQSWGDLGPSSLTYPALCTTAACTSTWSARTVSYGYYAANGSLLKSVDGFATIGYNADGTLNRVRHATGVTDWTLPDPYGMTRPCQIVVTGPATVSLTANTTAPCRFNAPSDALWNSGRYLYDGTGNITDIGSWAYQYDGVNRLTRAQNGTQPAETFGYDIFGNMTSHTGQTVAVSSATNRWNGTGTTYDVAGNLTTLQQVSGNITRQYHHVWDGVGTLRESYSTASGPVRLPFGRGNDRYFLYDADDERIATVFTVAAEPIAVWPPRPAGSTLPYSRIVYTLRGFGNEILRSVVDNLDFSNTSYGIAQQGTAIPRYSFGGENIWFQTGQLLAAIHPNASSGTTYTRHSHLDHLGSPQFTTDENGIVATTYSFSPFGAGGLRDDAVQFAGMERDATAAELVDYDHARYYDPAGGRFLSVDHGSPHLYLPQTFNRYAYVANNPLVLLDPNGMQIQISLVSPILIPPNDSTPDEGWGIESVDSNGAYIEAIQLFENIHAMVEVSRGGIWSQIGGAMSDLASVRNPVTGMTAGEHWRVSGQGLAAFADGVIPDLPFCDVCDDPLASALGLYDPDAPGMYSAQVVGATTRDIELALLTAGGTMETKAGAEGGNWVTNNLFRWGKGAWKNSGGKRWHFHAGPGKAMTHHLPYQFQTWRYHSRAIIRAFLTGWR